jgi:hypothetical protein
MFTWNAVEEVAADHRRRMMAQAEASRRRHGSETPADTPAETPVRTGRSRWRPGVAFGRRPATTIVAALHRS